MERASHQCPARPGAEKRLTAALIGSLYLAVLAAPAVHQALEEDPCVACVADAPGLPRLVADCSGPCENPKHHHHEGRHHKHLCPLCQKCQPADPGLVHISPRAAGEGPCVASPAAAPRPRPLLFAGIHPPRAPPASA